MERAASAGSIIWGPGNSRNRLNSIGKFTTLPQYPNEEKISASSSGYHGDVDSKDSQSSEIQHTKTYKRRFYILALFAITAFMQYCCWNTFGPISSTCMVIFDWTEAEIALMASLDPFTYLLTMLMFSWLMDVKGLRVAMVATAFFMAFGTGIRCITSNTEYVTWSMATGQFFNGLAGPVTQAAPTLLSGNWFPVNERTTATAVASLMGSLGVALSFIIGPTVVKEIDMKRYKHIGKLHVNESGRYHVIGNPSPRILADSIYSDAKYYWPFDNEDENIINAYPDQKLFQEYKNNYHGRAFGEITTSPGIFRNGVTTIANKKAWVNLGDFENGCHGRPSLCKQGLSVAFWVSFPSNTTKQFLLGTGGVKSRRNGFLISVKHNEKQNMSYMKVDVISKKKLWRTNFRAFPNTWNHVAITWNDTDGLIAYLNSTLVGQAKTSTKLQYTQLRGKSFTVGRVNNANRYSSASFDEIALWERVLKFEEVNKTYRHALHGQISKEQEALRQELQTEKEGLRKDVMGLLYVEFGVNALLFFLILLYFPDKPPTPPTKSSYAERQDFSVGVKLLLRSPAFWTLCLIYGITTGVYSGWGSLLNVNLSAFGISQKEAGWLGFYAILAGVTAGMMLARCADLLTGRMKALILLLFIGASGCFLWFSLLCLRIIPYSKDSLYKASILGGFFISGTIPLFYELTVEQVYPIAEGVTIGLMTLCNNIVTVLFLIVPMIPKLGTQWMNWALCGSCIICLPVLALFKEKYNRLNVDMSAKDLLENKNEKDNKKPDESELLSDEHLYITVNKVSKCTEQSKHSLLAVPETT